MCYILYMNKGTPGSLEEAIRLGLMTGPLKDAEKNVYEYVKAFIGSKVVDAMAFQDAVTLILLEKLFLSILSEER